MLNKKVGLLVATLSVISFASATAEAQVLWTALQTKPKPNMIIAYDVSTTSQIAPNCVGQCHASWGGRPNDSWTVTRLYQATGEMLNTLTLFKNDFVYGGLRYDTCGPYGHTGGGGPNAYTGGKWSGHCPGTCTDCDDDDGGDPVPLPSGAYCNQSGYAGVAEVSFMTTPDSTSPTTEVTSYNRVVEMISDIRTFPNSPNNVLGAPNYNGNTHFLACEHGEGNIPSAAGTSVGLVPPTYPGGVNGFVSNLITALGGGAGAVGGPTDLRLNGLPPNLLSLTCTSSTGPFFGQTIGSLPIGSALASLQIPLAGCPANNIDDGIAICQQLNAILGAIQSLGTGNPATDCFNPIPAWLTSLTLACNPAGITSGNTLCGNCGGGASATVFGQGTCICDPTQAGCLTTGTNSCGQNWTYRARQQLAICAAGDNTAQAYPTYGFPNTCPGAGCASIGQAFLAQPDNVVHGGISACRENVAIFVTDGYAGSSTGVDPAAKQMASLTGAPGFESGYANAPFYSAAGQVSNAYVFATSNVWASEANAMAASLSGVAGTQALPATDQVTLNTSFAKVLNRTEKGHYFSSNVALDPHATRLAVMSYSVPGHYAPGGTVTYPDERYFGHPTRVSWWAVDPTTGARTGSAPICETDWKSRAPIGGVNVLHGNGTFDTTVPAKAYVALGPPASATDNTGWLKTTTDPTPPGSSTSNPFYAEVPDDGSTDRGAGYVATGLPASTLGTCSSGTSGCYAYGYMMNGGSSQPVVVEAPHDVPPGLDSTFLKLEYQTTPQHRPRVIYSMAGGYLFAHNAGNYSSTPVTVNGVHMAQSYDDSTASACTELFRYVPDWVLNSIVAQPNIDPSFGGDAATGRGAGMQFPDLLTPQHYTEGQIAVREARIQYTLPPTVSASDYATVLVMSQGWAGPNFSVLDVKDPTAPTLIGEAALPAPSPPLLSNYTSSEPTIYSFPSPTAGQYQTVVLFTGGDGGEQKIFSYAITRSGVSALDTITLPAGNFTGSSGNYPSSVVCFDATASGTMTDCAVLSDAGKLVRVHLYASGLNAGKFNGYTDLSSIYPTSPTAWTTGYMNNEKFYTHPAVYFQNDGTVAYVFGSGDIKNINKTPAVANRIYKVVEKFSGSTSASGASSCLATSGSGAAEGVINLSTSQELITAPPIVARGTIAWTTYKPPTTGCGTGQAYVYAMQYQTCYDALNASNTRPAAQAIGGGGIPMSPSYVRSADKLIVSTSAVQPTAINTTKSTVTNRNRTGLIPIYWRPEVKAL